MKHRIFKRLIHKVYSEDLYTWDELFTEEETDEEFPEEILVNAEYGSDARPINIDELQKLIDELKEKGCTHVEIDYHCDHLNYDLYGYEIRRATKEELEAETKKEEESIKKRKEKEIENLKNKIKDLENEV